MQRKGLDRRSTFRGIQARNTNLATQAGGKFPEQRKNFVMNKGCPQTRNTDNENEAGNNYNS